MLVFNHLYVESFEKILILALLNEKQRASPTNLVSEQNNP